MRRPNEPSTSFGDTEYLRQTIKRTTDGMLLRRLQTILYRMQGKTISQTLELLDIHRDTLHDWVRKWNRGGIDELRTRKSPGRPRKFEPRHKGLVIKKIKGSLKDGTPYTALAIEGYLKKTNPP